MKLKTCFRAIFWLIAIFQVGQVQSDFYTSIAGLEQLLETEVFLVENFENYMKQQQKTNQQIIGFLDEVEKNFNIIEKDPIGYFGDPLNSFKVLKRFAIDWKRLENIVFFNLDGGDYAKNVSALPELDYVNATYEDLHGASKGMARLQSAYALKAADIAEGILLDWQYESRLSPHDCFILGRSLYESKQYLYATEWLIQARISLNAELEKVGGYPLKERMSYNFPFLRDVQILEFLAPSSFDTGNKKMARLLNEELLKLDPDNSYGKTNKELFEAHVLEERRLSLLISHEEEPIQKKTPVEVLYESVCRGEVKQTPRQLRNLHCRYSVQHAPHFGLLARFKVEELNHDPFVALYHDAIYEKEMELILNTTEENVERSKVGDGSISNYSDVRTSKNTWLWYEQNDFLKPIRQRLIDVTGLNLDFGEPLQVANYGIGGHYGPHYDFTEDPDTTFPDKGNRLLTALFYINDVDLGGATAFPFLKLAVPPIKGSLLVWYNMHESLELDYRTRHAGCPVLKGSKWICNEWFHQLGQEFLRPCSLKRYGNISWHLRDKV